MERNASPELGEAYLGTIRSRVKKLNRLGNLGCFLLMASILFFIGAATKESLLCVGLFLLCIGLGSCVVAARNRLSLKIHEWLLKSIFQSCGMIAPVLQCSSSYGYPAFQLTFNSESEMKRAEERGHIRAFKSALQYIHGDQVAQSDSFSADQAVYVTYVGQIEKMLAHLSPAAPRKA